MSTPIVPLKRCSKCHQEFPATSEYFCRANQGTFGLHSYCKPCQAQKHKQWVIDNPEKNRDNKRAWEAANPEKVKTQKKRAQSNNSDKIKKSGIKYRATHKDVLYERNKKYRARNAERIRFANAKRKLLKRSLPFTMTFKEWDNCLSHWHYCCAYCGHQRDFWNNLHMDHFIPIVNPSCPGTISINIVPACYYCNSSKNASHPIEWLEWKFGKRKAKKILARIQAYFDSL